MKKIELPQKIERISIIGYSGSGKSTLARKLGDALGLEVLHLDKVQWLKGWQERESSEKNEIVKDFLDANSKWVIDGTYHKLQGERRMDEADIIIFMNFGRLTCLFRAMKRNKQYKGKTRPCMTEGCEEKIDKEFFWWLVWSGRNKERRAKYTNLIRGHEGKTIVIKNQRQLNKFEKLMGL